MLEEKIDEKTPEEWNNEGYTHRRLKNYKEALRCYDRALQIDPYYSKAWNNKGFALDEMGRHEEAIMCYDKALEVDSQDAFKKDISNLNLLVDSFAWLEILKGSERGKKALYMVNKSEKVFTSVLNLYELRYRIEQIRDKKTANEYIKTIKSYTKVIDIGEEIALKGSLIRLEHKMSDVDSLILATARIHNLKILTGDKHFEGVNDVVNV